MRQIRQHYFTVRSWLYLNYQRFLVKIRLKKYVFISDAEVWEKNFGIHHDHLQNLRQNSDVFISYTNYEEKRTKKSLHDVAKLLSNKYRVTVYECIPEIGGGGEGAIAESITSLLRYRPVIDFVVLSALSGIIGQGSYDAIKKVFKKNKRNVYRAVIRKTINNLKLNFIFDGLTPKEAIKAYKLIDKVTHFNRRTNYNEDIYLRFNKKINMWNKIRD